MKITEKEFKEDPARYLQQGKAEEVIVTKDGRLLLRFIANQSNNKMDDVTMIMYEY